jgi:ribosomal protein S18 acetylase RimI-like enzyme
MERSIEMLCATSWIGADPRTVAAPGLADHMQLTADIAGDEQALLDLEFIASEPYTRFVFSSTGQALSVRQYLFERNLCEFSPPYGRLLRDDSGQPVGLLAMLSGAELTRCRLKATLALTRSEFLTCDLQLAARLQLAGQTLLKVLPEDCYISRVAAAEASRGQGIGAHLLREAEDEARRRGCPRIVLEVSPASSAALRLYRRALYEQIDSREVTDPHSGRSLQYLHLAKTLN